MRFQGFGLAVAACAVLFAGGTGARASLTYGTLDNFDVINDTEQECHGFEIELEGISASDVAYTFGEPYQRYGNPTIVTTANGVIIRYAAGYDPVANAWSATTPFSGPPYLPTQGHSCWTGGVPDPAQYFSCGCDHFGASLLASPTRTTYRWLVADPLTTGTLKAFGTDVTLPAPSWSVIPQPPPDPFSPAPPPIVNVGIEPPAPDQYEFGDAIWVKVFVTELENELEMEDLDHMVIDDPLVDIVPDEPAEVEIEWVLLQAGPGGVGEQEFGGEAGANSEVVSRRFEYYQYVGEYDPETHEALCDKAEDCPEAVGEIMGAHNAAINIIARVVPSPGRLVGDFDNSGCTDLQDFLFLLDNWQLDFEGQAIGINDFLALLDNWSLGPAC